ncbi:MAG: sugar-binding transcriptional regulator [Bacillota bacterium]
MKKIIDDEQTLIEISDLYYNQDLTQSEIAKRFQISRPTVSKMLQLAKKYGIVKIQISNVMDRNFFKLERKLQEKYNLKEVIIVNTKEDATEQKDELGKATAIYLSRIMKEDDIVGVSMGTTLSHIAKFVNHTVPYSKVTFIPLVGGLGQIEADLHANILAESLAKAYGGQFLPFHAPAVVSRYQTKMELLQEDSVRCVFEKIKKISIALLAIGNLASDSTILKAGYYSESKFQRFKEQGAVGDICLKFYDIHGNMNQFKSNENVIAVDFEELKEKSYTVALFAGVEKVFAAYGLLKGKLTNCIILDYECAKALYEMEV